jgi:glycosyltransferase involved in cell wall biosynthesis
MISIIMCTYNRGDRLQIFLNSLEGLEIDRGQLCEVIIVDNNSTDETEKVIREFSKISLHNIRYLFEGRPGNNHARNLAISKSMGEILAFTDDDCVLDPQWIRRIQQKFELELALACVGGRVDLYDKNDRAISIRSRMEETEINSASQLYGLIIGCNMAIRRWVFDEIGMFDSAFGPGSKIGSGGDSEFLYRAYRRGLLIKYYPDILVYHNHGRKTDAEVRALGKRYVRGRGGFYCKYILQGDCIIMKMALHEVTSLMKGLIKNLFLGKSTQSQWRRGWGLTVGAMRGLPIFLSRAVAARSRHAPTSQ